MTSDVTQDGLDKVSPEQRNTGLIDNIGIWSATGINTGSWYFGGVTAALGFATLVKFSVIWLPLVMIPWAALAYIGYKYGASTVSVTRPSLGVHGAKLTGLFEFIILIGWPTINSYIAGISLTYLFKSEFGWAAYGEPGSTWPLILGICITAVFQGLFIIIGHNAIKYLERFAMVLLVVLGIWQTYIIATNWSFTDIVNYKFSAAGSEHSFFYYLDMGVAFSWTWAQVCDFSRYSKSKASATFGTWFGINLGQGWFMIIGGIGVIGVALQTGVFNPDNSDPSSIMAKLGLGMVAFLILAFATISTNVTNLYGAAVGLAGMLPKVSNKRVVYCVALLQLLLCFIPLGFGSFIDYFEAFLSIAGAIFIPLWTVVLVDYFIIRKCNPAEKLYFATRGAGISDWNIAGIISVALGFLTYYLSYNVYPQICESVSALLPTMVVSGVIYCIAQSFSRR